MDVSDLLDILNRAWSQIELINMAAEAGTVTGEAGNAIAWGCIAVQELLDRVKDHLEPRTIRIASKVSFALPEMLSDHAKVTLAINQHTEDADHPEVVALCKRQTEIARAIIGYHPLTTADIVRKVEFLREWTDGTRLTEEEEDALIASMLPEGGAK
jgi:hypothetical protein